MQTVIKKRGKGAAVHIPATVLEAARLQVGVAVEVRQESGRIVIEPLRRRLKTCDLDALIAGITSANLHDEASFDLPMGHEAI